jgi:negative regulator of sigma E activity
MPVPKSILMLAARSCVCLVVAVGLAVVGCTSETIEMSPTTKADQKQMLEKGVDQTARNKSGKTLGRPIPSRSIKSKVLGAATE